MAKAVSQALNNCVNCLPGLREVDVAVKHITTVSMKLSQPQVERHSVFISISVQCRPVNCKCQSLAASESNRVKALTSFSCDFTREVCISTSSTTDLTKLSNLLGPFFKGCLSTVMYWRQVVITITFVPSTD